MPLPPPTFLPLTPLLQDGHAGLDGTPSSEGAWQGWSERLLNLAMGVVQPPAARARGGTAALAAAVASIVGVAAQRAQAAGDLANLRALIERALDAVDPPAVDPPEGTGLPRIADTDAERERDRLLSLMSRQSRR